jgi:hypothetical protein
LFVAALSTRAPAGSDAIVGASAIENGQFEVAQQAFARGVARDPGDVNAQLGLAQIALYDNRVGDARRALLAVMALQPHNAKAQAMLRAANDRDGRRGEFTIKRFPGSVRLEAVSPVPIVRARINGGKDGYFVVDTTATGVELSDDFARSIGFDPGLPTHLTSVAIGSGEIDAIPATIVKLSERAVFDNEPVAGVLGVAFLRRFFFTLDEHAKRAVFDPPRQRETSEGRNGSRMWFGDERHIFTRARINNAPPALFSIDTAVPGGLLVTASTFTAAHLQINRPQLVDQGGTTGLRMFPITASVTFARQKLENVDGTLLTQGTPSGEFPFPVGGTVGNGVLGRLRVTFDFTNMLLTFVRTG